MAGVKRALDLTIASVALVLLSPVMLAAGLGVWLTMGSPILFRQARAGRNGVCFDVLKFRTMREPRTGEDGPEHDLARVTSLGRFLRRASVDELPSLLNVLRGEMSIVGPRPLPVAYVERYTPEQARRLEVLPGLTGWAVVHGRNRLGWSERFALDTWYVDNQSLLLDVRIIWLTVSLVLRGANVNHDGNTTMTEFLGEGG